MNLTSTKKYIWTVIKPIWNKTSKHIDLWFRNNCLTNRPFIPAVCLLHQTLYGSNHWLCGHGSGYVSASCCGTGVSCPMICSTHLRAISFSKPKDFTVFLFFTFEIIYLRYASHLTNRFQLFELIYQQNHDSPLRSAAISFRVSKAKFVVAGKSTSVWAGAKYICKEIVQTMTPKKSCKKDELIKPVETSIFIF